MPIKAIEIVDMWEIEEYIENANERGSIDYTEVTQNVPVLTGHDASERGSEDLE